MEMETKQVDLSTPAKVRKALENLHPASIRRPLLKTDPNLYEVRWSFFYRMGRSAEKYAEGVKKLLGDSVSDVDGSESWQAWPRTSYFVVRFNVRKEEAK